jgi:formyltetrahydrofolate deformylase
MRAASHFITEDLEGGPIIEQDRTRVLHRDQVADSAQKGRDLQRIIPSRLYLGTGTIVSFVYGNKTVVFN